MNVFMSCVDVLPTSCFLNCCDFLSSEDVPAASSTKISSLFRVVFLTENHTSQQDRARNVALLEREYEFKRGDIILVEDDQTKSKNELNLSQIAGFEKGQNVRIEGWDHHESTKKRQELARTLEPIEASLSRLETGPISHNSVNDFLILKITATKVGLKEWRNVEIDNLLSCPNLITVELTKKPLLPAIRYYLDRVRGVTVYKEFGVRQGSMIDKIHECLEKESDGVVFVMTGKKHLDFTDQKVASYAKQLFDSLQGIPYAIG